MKTSKIKNIQGAGEKNGWLNFDIDLEDGTSGRKGFKTQPNHLSVGLEVEYEMNEQYPNLFKKLQTKGFVPKTYNGSAKKNSVASFALSYSKDLAVGDVIKVDEILEYATKFNQWLKDNE